MISHHKNCTTFASSVKTNRRTLNLDSFLIDARIPGTGHDHGDCRAVLLPHGGAAGQFTFQGALDDFV